MFIITYMIDSTDNVNEFTAYSEMEVATWIEEMFYEYGSRLAVTSIRKIA